MAGKDTVFMNALDRSRYFGQCPVHVLLTGSVTVTEDSITTPGGSRGTEPHVHFRVRAGIWQAVGLASLLTFETSFNPFKSKITETPGLRVLYRIRTADAPTKC